MLLRVNFPHYECKPCLVSNHHSYSFLPSCFGEIVYIHMKNTNMVSAGSVYWNFAKHTYSVGLFCFFVFCLSNPLFLIYSDDSNAVTITILVPFYISDKIFWNCAKLACNGVHCSRPKLPIHYGVAPTNQSWMGYSRSLSIPRWKIRLLFIRHVLSEKLNYCMVKLFSVNFYY